MISVVLATYNEEKNLPMCLDAVADLADEIIIVDGSSTDTTVAIAKKYKAKVISTTNKPNFHINKQMAMDAATGDVVLQLDADEVVDAELAAFVKRINTKTTSTAEKNVTKGWWIKRKNLFLGKFLKKGGQYPDPVIRLYINGHGSLPQKDVHEQMSIDGEVGLADGHLLHYSNPTFADYLRKFNTYTSFSALQLFENKQTLSATFILQSLLLKPLKIFFTIFVRHKGFVDGIPGFLFALMSSLHPPVVLLKLWEQQLSGDAR